MLGVTGWRFALPPERRQAQAYATYVSLEVGGTGKGAFRRMYARFLREASVILGEPELERVGDSYAALARDWSRLAEFLRQSSQDPERGLFSEDPGHDALTRHLLEGEHAALDRLRTVAERWP